MLVGSQDPVRWWPSGTTQSWACLGAAVALYKTVPGSPRVKTAAALSSLGITIPMTVLSQAIENPNGFNKFMYCAIEYKRTGRWPLLPQDRVISDDGNTKNFISSISDFLSILYNYLDSLTLLQELALFNMILCSVLILTVVNISSVLFGNAVIKYFNLEERFPRLGAFFRLRITFQIYYLLWNVLILFVVCLCCIGINTLLFIANVS